MLDSLTVFLVPFFIVSLASLLILLLYPFTTSLSAKNKELAKRKLENFPEVSVIVPTYMEEDNIERKIDNLYGIDYPQDKLEVLVVDSGSTDDTRSIAEEKGVKVINLKKRGKIKAINHGVEESSYEHLLLTDADVFQNKNALKEALIHLVKGVGAVGGRSRIETDVLYQKSKKMYHERDWDLRSKESVLDSTASLDGKFILTKKEFFEDIDEEAYTDDLQLTVDIRKKGLRAIIPETVFVTEKTPDKVSEDIQQMRRRCSLSIGNSVQNLGIVKDLEKFQSIIFPVRRFLSYFLPFKLLVVSAFLILTSPLIFSFLVGLNIVLSVLKPQVFYYNILTFILLLSWKDYLLGRTLNGCRWD